MLKSVMDGMDPHHTDWLTPPELLELERSMSDWSRHFFPKRFNRPFTSYQVDFCNWFGSMNPGDAPKQPRVECEPRGVGKSTNGRTGVVYLLARKVKYYALIVSATESQAKKHFAAVKKQLEDPRLLAQYPHLRPQTSVHRNMSTNWSADRLVTAEGQVVEFISILGNARGFNTEEGRRIDLIVIDDIDDQKDSVDVTEKKLDILASNILGAGDDQTDVVMLQNLIHRTSICTRLRDNNAGILVNRHFVGPFPMCAVVQYAEEKIIGDETGAKRYVLTDFQPFDPATSADYVASLLNRLGPKTFLRECQQDLTVVDEDKDFREFSEIFHVITYSEFYTYWKKYGVPVLNEQRQMLQIPSQWNVGLGQDWGCLTLDTEILTKQGWKLHSELEIGEIVAAYDWSGKREIVWTPLNKIVYKEDQPLVEMRNKSFRFQCTPDHSWIVKRRKRGKMVADTYRRQRLDQIAPTQTSLVLAAECSEGGELQISPSEAAVLGWIVTDGWVSTKGVGIAYLCQKNYADNVIDDLQKSGLEWSELQPKSNGVRIFRLSAVAFADLCDRSGFSGKKSLPAIAAALSPDARRSMLEVMLLAEGTNNGTSRKAIFCQKSGPVSDAFQILATLCGQRLGVEREHQSQWGTSNRIPLLRHRNITKPTIIPLDGLHRVWCPSVNEGAVVARHRGQVTITGNTTVGHPAAIIPVARPNKAVPLNDSFFTFGEVVLPEYPNDVNRVAPLVSPGRVAAAERAHLNKWNVQEEQIVLRLMSHEASAARNTYSEDLSDEMKVYYDKWKAARGSGVPQLQNVLEIDFTQDHPFRRYPKEHPDKTKRGKPLKGRPKYYILVPDDQGALKCDPAGHLYVAQPINGDGCARLRAEMPVYSHRNTGNKKIFDDAVDALRGLAGEYMILPQALTSEERYLEMLAKQAPDLLPSRVTKLLTDEERSLVHARERVMRAEFEEAERRRSRVYDDGFGDYLAEVERGTERGDDYEPTEMNSTSWREL